MVHTDAGSVLESEDPPEEEGAEDVLVELPPAYDPSFVTRGRRAAAESAAGGAEAGAGPGERRSTAETLRAAQSGETLRPAGGVSSGPMGQRASTYEVPKEL